MPNPHPTPPPKGIGKFAVFAGIIVLAVVVATFIGMNAQHVQDTREQQAGNVKPQDAPMHQKDLGKPPVQSE